MQKVGTDMHYLSLSVTSLIIFKKKMLAVEGDVQIQ